jgi:RHS repeat-associated protein
MALSVRYTNIDGRTVKENRGGTKRGYVPDPLGSTKALVDSTGAVTDTWEYWPYGEVESHAGSSTTPFTFVGTLGYFRDAGSKLTYVRARYFHEMQSCWNTKDSKWPAASAYSYAMSSPLVFIDASGRWPKYRNAPQHVKDTIDNLCSLLYFLPSNKLVRINACIELAAAKAGIECLGITENRKKCIERWCDEDGILTIKRLPTAVSECPGTPAFGSQDRWDPADDIHIDLGNLMLANTYATWLLVHYGLEYAFLHELMHACGQKHNNPDDVSRSCNNIQACCIVEVVLRNRSGIDCRDKL